MYSAKSFSRSSSTSDHAAGTSSASAGSRGTVPSCGTATLGSTAGLTGLTALPSLPGLSGPSPAGDGFGQLVTENLDKLQGLHSASDDMAVKAATGDLKDVHDYMIASSQSSVATELTVAVRNKAVEAFTEIMRMQV